MSKLKAGVPHLILRPLTSAIALKSLLIPNLKRKGSALHYCSYMKTIKMPASRVEVSILKRSIASAKSNFCSKTGLYFETYFDFN